MRESMDDILAFIAVANDKSFTQAAARLGVSQSSLSRTIRKLEERLGLRLLIRTTRSVSPTEAGQRLLDNVGPRLREIEAELISLGEMRVRPTGSVRITATDYAAKTLLWPRLMPVIRDYPDISLEIISENGFVDIAAEGIDAGVRTGDSVERDMVIVRIGPDIRLIPVAAPSYLHANGIPETPQDLSGHTCVNLRLLGSGALYAWEFEGNGQSLRQRVDGQLTFSSTSLCIDAALEGFGIACAPESAVLDHIAAGRLVAVLDEWCPVMPGYHLYYPSRRQHSAAFQIIVDSLRYRG